MSIRAKDLGAQVPRRGTALTQWLGEWLLARLGWRITGTFPDVPRAVFIGAPHTSNKDGLIAAGTMMALRLNIRVMMKAEIFVGPFGSFFRFIGFMPVARSKSKGLVEQSAAYLRGDEDFYLGIAPEGTRHASPEFKRGFYLIALKAGVPIIPFALDYANRELRLMSAFMPTGDWEADLPRLLACWRDVVPGNPDRLSLPLKALNAQPREPDGL